MQELFHFTDQNPEEKETNCLGRVFSTDEERREFFRKELRRFIEESDVRDSDGFPVGETERIVELSDPPYFTACPNPFLTDFIKEHSSAKPQDYDREPFAIDVSVGKTDQLYRAHGYHTKVPHLAIVPSILHYTNPGDVVLDGFCGSGMTGIAAQWCGTAPTDYKRSLESDWRADGHRPPVWGARRVILNDLGFAATFIAANYNTPFAVGSFVAKAQMILDEVEAKLGWMYETTHGSNGRVGRINYTVWSEVLQCTECSGEIIFVEQALDKKTKKVKKTFPCPCCGAEHSKKNLDRVTETVFDRVLDRTIQRPKRTPVLINYTIGKEKFEKVPDSDDLKLIQRIEELPLPPAVPIDELPYMHMTHERARMDYAGITHVHHFFLPRQRQALGVLWELAMRESDTRLRNSLLYFVEQAIWGMSLLARYAPTHFSQVNRQLSGVYYVGSQIVDVSPHYILDGKLSRLEKAFSPSPSLPGSAMISTGSCTSIPIESACVDYIFTDPPFGENLYYADLNFLVEAWHGVLTNSKTEAIVDRAKKKTARDYQELMRKCFREYFRVLRPGRWMTVVFSNSSNQIWRAIQEAIGTAGFVIADVRTLDKKQGSYRQVTSSAVKQDLVISAYKPSAELAEKFSLDTADESTAWAFVAGHLKNVPVFVGRSGEEAEPVVERTPQMLHDRMVAFFVQRRMSIPISSPDFFSGLDERYAKRDGMYFLPDQVAEYDRKRMTVKELRELDLFVSDEASAIQWLRQQLDSKPQNFQDLQPKFMPQVQTWPKHEKDVDLKELLEQSFLRYDGKGEVPSQIANYLSKNYREFRGVSRESSALKEKAKDRWYVPDPRKTGDLEKLRFKTLIKEFEEYKNSKDRKIKLFRTEAVKAGFKDCYDKKDYQTIIKIAKKLPSSIIEEDEALLMYYDVASMRAGD